MERPIEGFRLDSASDWVAELSCGHAQHVRHDPPFRERAWVVTPEGRESRLGSVLDCLRCDRRELPSDYVAARRTPSFNEQTIPDGLQKLHSTKRGVWALIHVAKGELEYRILEPFNETSRLTPQTPGVVLPEVEHFVTPLGSVEFCVEFWRASRT